MWFGVVVLIPCVFRKKNGHFDHTETTGHGLTCVVQLTGSEWFRLQTDCKTVVRGPFVWCRGSINTDVWLVLAPDGSDKRV